MLLYDLIAQARGPATSASTATPNRPPLYKPFERQMGSVILEALASGYDPSSALDMLIGINQQATGRRADRRENIDRKSVV